MDVDPVLAKVNAAGIARDGKLSVLEGRMIINAICLLIYAFVMNWLVGQTNRTSFVGGATLGALIGTVCMLTTYVSNRFAMNPTISSIIDGSYYIVLFAVIGGIVGAWRKK